MTTPPSFVRTRLFGRSAISCSARHSKAGFTALESLIVLGVVAIISWVLFALWKHEEPEAVEREVPARQPPTLLVRPDAAPPAESQPENATTDESPGSYGSTGETPSPQPGTGDADDDPGQGPAVAGDGR